MIGLMMVSLAASPTQRHVDEVGEGCGGLAALEVVSILDGFQLEVANDAPLGA